MAAFCGACGTAISPGASRCATCGAAVGAPTPPWDARTLERYAPQHLLGRGVGQVVWLARDSVLRRPVAVKQLEAPTPEAAEALRRDLRAAAALQHAHAAAVFDLVVCEGSGSTLVLLVREYVDGMPLAQLAAERGGLSPTAAASLLRGPAEALAAAHRAGIVHRGIGVDAVLVDRSGVTKLADFGIGPASATPADDVRDLGRVLRAVLRGADPGPLTEVLRRLEHPDPTLAPDAAGLARALSLAAGGAGGSGAASPGASDWPGLAGAAPSAPGWGMAATEATAFPQAEVPPAPHAGPLAGTPAAPLGGWGAGGPAAAPSGAYPPPGSAVAPGPVDVPLPPQVVPAGSPAPGMPPLAAAYPGYGTAPEATSPRRGSARVAALVALALVLAVLGFVAWRSVGGASSTAAPQVTVTVAAPRTTMPVRPTPSGSGSGSSSAAPTTTSASPSSTTDPLAPPKPPSGPVTLANGNPGEACAATGGPSFGEYPGASCKMWQPSTGLRSGKALSKTDVHTVACQADLGQANPVFAANQTNTWWVWTQADDGTWDWFPETAVSQGAANAPINGVAVCLR